MAFNGLAIALREVMPADKAHHAGGVEGVEHENRGAIAPHRAQNRFQRGVVDVVDGLRAEQLVGEAVERVLLARALVERVRGAFGLGNVTGDLRCAHDAAGAVANR